MSDTDYILVWLHKKTDKTIFVNQVEETGPGNEVGTVG